MKYTGVHPLFEIFIGWASSLAYSVKATQASRSGTSSFWASGTSNPEDWSADERSLREIPQYVIDHAPLVHLYTGEQYWPCDIEEHLQHVSAYVNHFPLKTEVERRKLTNLDGLNVYGLPMYLTSDDNVEDHPSWLTGGVNIPETRKVQSGCGGRSQAPVPLVVVDKGEGVVDAFWFFFYSFNLGNKVLGARYGNHVGDWESTVVRFQGGAPTQVFFSEHAHGQAYTYEAVEKVGKRPVGYSATGTHAMYATPGEHAYSLPFGLLHDVTDKGPLWDPVLNMHSYTYNLDDEILRSSNITPRAPTGWFYYEGRWGDKAYPSSDERQYIHFGQRHYTNGPFGPRFKALNRTEICLGDGECEVKDSLDG